jgi:hypothetical protein
MALRRHRRAWFRIAAITVEDEPARRLLSCLTHVNQTMSNSEVPPATCNPALGHRDTAGLVKKDYGTDTRTNRLVRPVIVSAVKD